MERLPWKVEIAPSRRLPTRRSTGPLIAAGELNVMRNNKFNNRIYIDIFHALSPYIAVLLGLYFLKNAWFSLLLYHFQIIIYTIFRKPDIRKLLFWGFSIKQFLIFVLPLLLCGLLLYILFPYILSNNILLKEWLYAYGLNNKNFLILIPYFSLIHPLLEEIHWGKFRESKKYAWIMWIFFAGYHILVLANLLTPSWLIISFLVLVAAAYAWAVLYKKLNGGVIPFLSHILADIGIITATYTFIFK